MDCGGSESLPRNVPEMKIGFDTSQTGRLKAGCGYFADGLIRELAASDTSNEYILYPAVGDVFWDPEWKESFSFDRPNFKRMDAPRDFTASRKFWRCPGPDFEARLGNPNVVHINNFYCPHGLRTARLVYTLYDLSFLVEPSWTTEPNRVGCFDGVFRASLVADYIVAISEYTRQHFLTTFPHYPENRVSVIHPAGRFTENGLVKRPSRFSNLDPGGFWLSVGTIEPRKNHGRLLEAYRIVRTEDRDCFPLVLAGGKGWLMNDFEARLTDLGLRESVVLAGYVSDAELQWLYQNCFALIYPSLFEGFGMPVLEALTLGAPVLCSNATSLPEVGGKGVMFFDPIDPCSIASAMKRLANGDVDREVLRSTGREQANKFSWARSAGGIRAVYEQVSCLPRLGSNALLHKVAGV
jgi:glycosyltransferase involved in cell wall biosynthesis